MRKLILSRFFYPGLLILVVIGLYYKLFIFGKIPFPGDLLVTSYSPWLDYYKFPVQNPLISDVFSQFYIWKSLSVEIFKNGFFPLWNPYSFIGTPLLATYHSAVLYPLNILLLLKTYGWGLFIFSQTLIAALSMYLLLSLWVSSQMARITGALIFSFGSLMTTWLEFGTAVHAISWLPLSLYIVYTYLENYKLRFLYGLVFSLSLTILAGNPQITIYTFFVVLLFSFSELLHKRKLLSIQAGLLSIAILFSIFICSIQLLPSLDLLQKSIRAGDSYIQENNFGLLPLKESLKFFSADYYGNPVTRNYWGFLNYSETSPFVGTLSLPLLIYAFLYLKRNLIFYLFSGLLLLSLLLSFNNPISILIFKLKIPLLTLSYASRMLFLVNLSVAVISALSLDNIDNHLQDKKFSKSLLYSTAVLIGITVGTVAVIYLVKAIIQGSSSKFYTSFYLNDAEYSISNYYTALRNMILPIFYLTILFVVSKLLRKNLLCLLLVTFLIFDLGRYFLKYNPFVDSHFIYPKTPGIEFLQKQSGLFRVGREHAEVLPPNTWTQYNLQSLEGYDPFYLSEYAKFMHFLNDGDLRTGSTGRYAELSAKYSSPFLDAANIKYFVGIGRDNEGRIPGDLLNYKFKEAKYRPVFKDKSFNILENPSAMPRVYFISSVISKTSLPEVRSYLMLNPGFDPTKEAVVLGKTNSLYILDSKAEILKYSANQIRVSVQAPNDSFLILADQFEEGWHAKIDNQESKIFRANLVFRGLEIPRGNHEILFYYLPGSFLWGASASSITLVLLALLLIPSILYKRW